jgi:hypothetical protein
MTDDLNLYTAPPNEPFWMLVYDDNSDAGESCDYFADEDAAKTAMESVRITQREGNESHPAPENPRLRLFRVELIGGSSSPLTPGAGDATQGAKDAEPGTVSDSPPPPAPKPETRDEGGTP